MVLLVHLEWLRHDDEAIDEDHGSDPNGEGVEDVEGRRNHLGIDEHDSQKQLQDQGVGIGSEPVLVFPFQEFSFHVDD